MTHLICPKCGSNDHIGGYGFAAGPLGGYTFCNNDACGILLEFSPDTEGLSEEEAKAAIDKRDTYMKELWGSK